MKKKMTTTTIALSIVIAILSVVLIVQFVKQRRAKSIADNLKKAGFADVKEPDLLNMTVGIGEGLKAIQSVTPKTTTTVSTFDPSRFQQTVTRSADGTPAPTAAEQDAYALWLASPFADGKTRFEELVDQFIIATKFPKSGIENILRVPSQSGITMVAKQMATKFLPPFIETYNTRILTNPELKKDWESWTDKGSNTPYQQLWSYLNSHFMIKDSETQLFKSLFAF
jgi:hypothetical protein